MLGVDADKSSLTNAWHRLLHKMMFERKKKPAGENLRYLCH